jgi:hypothetical protein
MCQDNLQVCRRGDSYLASRGGHFGWWWIAGSLSYFYVVREYLYRNPYMPVLVLTTTSELPARYCYYCEIFNGNYRYVA